jgi:hypothetical protein
MEKNHQLMGGDVQLFKRSNSQFWYCQASVGGRRHRISAKKESLKLAEDVAKDWFLTLQGKARAGLLTSERTFVDAAKKFMAEYETITKGRRSPKWVAGHEVRLRLQRHALQGGEGGGEADAEFGPAVGASRSTTEPAGTAASQRKTSERDRRPVRRSDARGI